MAAGSISTRPLGASTRAGEFEGNSRDVDVQPLLIRTSASGAIRSRVGSDRASDSISKILKDCNKLSWKIFN